MRRQFLLFLSLLFVAGVTNAKPVDISRAQKLGQKFVLENFANARENNDLKLVYTGVSSRGEACFYAFNAGNSGFVIISADDCYRPVVGYSDEGVFETENMSPELKWYLDNIAEGRSQMRKSVQSPEVAAEWQLFAETGRLLSFNKGKTATYLVQTKWNQDSPYNKFCPHASGGSGGRAYAGCVATAMSQVMKYWNYPEHGMGSHTYVYGGDTLMANFGEATYEFDNMKLSIGIMSPEEDVIPIAWFMYHCGIAVDMMYSGSGSGAYSEDVPDAILKYFGYTNKARLRKRDAYSLEEWQNMLKDSFDQGWPVYYSGSSDDGGHAFVCDGYNDADLFHYNFGWSGSNDGWYVIDEIDFNRGADAIFNYVPAEVFENTAKSVSGFTAVANGDDGFSATLSWVNPSLTIGGNNIESLEKVIVMRDGEIVNVIENPTPGAAMTYVDETGVPMMVNYTIYVVNNGINGKKAYANNVNLGPTCPWTITTTESWNDGCLSVYNNAGLLLAKISSDRAESTDYEVEMSQGLVRFVWTAPADSVNLTFSIKDSENRTVFAFEGASADMPNGIFFIANNSCSLSTDVYEAPKDLTAETVGNDIVLNWTGIDNPGYGYNIYRDDFLYSMVPDGTTFIDRNAGTENHCYHITAFTAVGESDASNEACANVLSEYAAPKDLHAEVLENGRVKLTWTAPEVEGFSGYIIYRKSFGTEYERIKLATSNSTSYTDNKTLKEGDIYCYQIVAYYQESATESAPAMNVDDPKLNYVVINKTAIPTHLVGTVQGNEMLLEWDAALNAETYNVYCNGEKVAAEIADNYFTASLDGENTAFTFHVTGVKNGVESSASNKVYHGNVGVGENSIVDLQVYPNPTDGKVIVEANGLVSVAVYDVLGQEVMQAYAADNAVTLNLSGLQSGVYFVKANTATGNSIQKIILN